MSRLKVSLHGKEIQTLELRADRQYSVGRGVDCDVRLDEHPGVSRLHFRLRAEATESEHSDRGQRWIAEITSKFGVLMRGGAPASEIALEGGDSFQVAPYDFQFISDEDREASTPGVAPFENFAAERTFGGNEDATSIASIKVVPYVRILAGPSNAEREIKLTGGPWIAGREESCDITLDDTKASRKQFEIAESTRGWTIKDLGSSNGTSLNGKTIPANELITLKSGDLISVHALSLVFEVRDSAFAHRAAALAPASVHYEAPGTERESQAPITPYASERQTAPWTDPHTSAKTNKKSLLVAAAVLVVAIAWMLSSDNSKPAASNAPSGPTSLFDKLLPSEKQRIENTYRLAQEFYIRKEYDMALAQIENIHKTLPPPQGYQRSVELAESIAAAKRAIEEQESIRRQREELQRQEAEVSEVISRCRSVAARAIQGEEIRACLARALELRPENAVAQAMIEAVEQRRMNREASLARQVTYRTAAVRGRALFKKAEVLAAAGKRKEAILAYAAHIRSRFPDPDNLKEQSRENSKTLRAAIDTDARNYLDQAQRSLDKADYRSALESAIKAKGLDEDNERAAGIGARAKRELESQLSALYADSVVYESFGQLDSAKEKWRKILDMDRQHGDYWRKARNKLNSYGGS